MTNALTSFVKRFGLKAGLCALLLLGVSTTLLGQAALTQTTLSAAVNGPQNYTGAAANVTIDNQITVASTTGFVAQNNGAIASMVMVDQEAMGVLQVNTTTKVVTVVRGYAGTRARPHASGATVSVATPDQFLNFDPNGSCTGGGLTTLPVVSLQSGNIFTCDSTTGVWVVQATPYTYMFADHGFFIPEANCGGSTTGTAGSGNATDIVALSGGTRVFRVSATNASSSANTFTCNFSLPVYRTTTNKGCLLTDITFLVSAQSTIPTSITLPTLKTFSIPAAAASETANSATFVTAGGTLTILPTSANFAALAAVNAGQFYSIKTSLGTPVFVNTDLQQFQYTIVFNQSASAASLQETPGLIAHCTEYPL